MIYYAAREAPRRMEHVSYGEALEWDIVFIVECDLTEGFIVPNALYTRARNTQQIFMQLIDWEEYDLLHAFDVERTSLTIFRINYSRTKEQKVIMQGWNEVRNK